MRFGGLIAAIVFAAVAAFIVFRMSAGDDKSAQQQVTSSPPQVKTVNIYVAAQPIPIGTTVTQDMVAIQPWPDHLVLSGFVRADSGTTLVGMITRAPFQAQEPLLITKLANANDPNFLAGSLPKGMRIITIQTNEIEGIAGFVFPGDHIDVLLTHDVKKWVAPPSQNNSGPAPLTQETQPVTETLLTNVVVMAVDQRSTSAESTDKKGQLLVPRSVSLMVSPTDAQRIRLGAKSGTLTLALRSLADRESAEPLTLTTPSDISQFPSDESPAAGASVMIVRGTVVEASKSQSGPASTPTSATNTAPVLNPSAAATAPPPVAPASPLVTQPTR